MGSRGKVSQENYERVVFFSFESPPLASLKTLRYTSRTFKRTNICKNFSFEEGIRSKAK